MVETSLNDTIPTEEELLDLDSFDLSFLILTGHVKMVDNFDLAFDVLKAVKGQAMYDPEVELMTGIFRKALKKHFSKLTKEIISSFTLTGNISVNPKKIEKAFKKYRNSGTKVWEDVQDKILQLLAITQERASNYFGRQQKKQIREAKKKADGITTDAWHKYSTEALSDHVAAFTKEYPDRILHPEVQRMIKITEMDEKERLLTKHALKERIRGIKDLPEKYFENVSDVYAGRAWAYTGIQMAHTHGVTEYQVIAQNDRRTCKVCSILDGKTFSVQQAYDNMNKFFTTLCPHGKAETPEYCDYFSG